jgi:hypothetical protein
LYSRDGSRYPSKDSGALAFFSHCGFGFVGQGQQLSCVFKDSATGFRQHDAVGEAEAVEEGRTQFLFQALDVGGDVGLRIAQLGGGAGEVLFQSHGPKCLQLQQVEHKQ